MGLDSIEIVMELEERFRIKIPDEDAEQVKTVGELAELVLRRVAIESRAGELGMPGDPANAREFAIREVSTICAGVIGMDVNRIKPDSSLVEDLGCD